MSFLHPHRHTDQTEAAEAVEVESTHPNYDVQTDLALPHTGHEDEIDAGIGMLGGSLVPSDEHVGYDAARDIGFTP